MGNMVKIPEEGQDREFIVIRRKYFKEYGTNDHEINMLIGKNLGLNKKELEILNGKRSRKNEQTAKSDNYEIKICAYCDQREMQRYDIKINHYLCGLMKKKQIN